MRRTVYLSGRIDGLHYDEAIAARGIAADMLVAGGWDILDPMRGTKTILEGKIINDDASQRPDSAIILRDLDDIKRCDVLLVLTADDPSYGTLMEWGWAGIALRKPIVAIDIKKKARKSPWPRFHTMFFADTVEEGCKWIIHNLDRGYQL